jgi:hypothetical protein
VARHGSTTYYGKWQFDLPTWRSVGGPGLPSDQPVGVQDHFAYLLYERRGWGPWACARIVGLIS